MNASHKIRDMAHMLEDLCLNSALSFAEVDRNVTAAYKASADELAQAHRLYDSWYNA